MIRSTMTSLTIATMPRFAPEAGRRGVRLLVPAAALLLIGCSGSSQQANQSIDINGAALRAQNDVDRYSSEKAAATPTKVAKPVAAVGAGDPAAIVRDYFAALAAHRYDQAGLLREDGATRATLDSGVAPYRQYDATVGRAGPVDGGAGQLHVTVPVIVAVDGTGGPGTLAGKVVLHRVNDGIETADANAHRWRISAVDLKRR